MSLATEITAHADRLMRRLLRHRERYVRAWVAATGLDPRDCVLNQSIEYGEDKVTYRTWCEPKEQTDAVKKRQ